MYFCRLVVVFVFAIVFVFTLSFNSNVAFAAFAVTDSPAVSAISKQISNLGAKTRDHEIKMKQYDAAIKAVGEDSFTGLSKGVGGQFSLKGVVPELPEGLGSIKSSIDNPEAIEKAVKDGMYLDSIKEEKELDAEQRDIAADLQKTARISAAIHSYILAQRVQTESAKFDDNGGLYISLKGAVTSSSEGETVKNHIKANTNAMIEFVRMLGVTNMLTAQSLTLQSTEYLGE
ncbi:MAG: hypothetical protein KAJ75_07585 [Alphaproteobacteria bacterium]|nr:hypothetical protein [Alphaproteobacteria bacterium]